MPQGKSLYEKGKRKMAKIESFDIVEVMRKFDRLNAIRKVVAELLKAEVEIKVKTISKDCFHDDDCGKYCYILTIFYPLKEEDSSSWFEKYFDTADELYSYLDAMEDALRISHGEEV
jgi:hypothetical protein